MSLRVGDKIMVQLPDGSLHRARFVRFERNKRVAIAEMETFPESFNERMRRKNRFVPVDLNTIEIVVNEKQEETNESNI